VLIICQIKRKKAWRGSRGGVREGGASVRGEGFKWGGPFGGIGVSRTRKDSEVGQGRGR